MNDLALQAAREVQVTCEGIPRVDVALAMVAVTFRPTCIILAISPVLISVLSITAGTTTKNPRVVIIPIARSSLHLTPVVVAVPVTRAAAARATRVVAVPFVVARVVVARVEVKHCDLRTFAGRRPRAPTIAV